MNIEEIKKKRLDNINDELTQLNKQIAGLETQRYNLNVQIEKIEMSSSYIIKKDLFKTLLYLVSAIEGKDYLFKLSYLTDNTVSYIVCDTYSYDSHSLDCDGTTSFLLACDEGDNTLYLKRENLAHIPLHFNYVKEFVEKVLIHQINKEYYLFEVEMKELADEVIEEHKGTTRKHEK